MNQDIIILKAQAYDILAQMEYLQKKLQEVNATIAQMQAQEQESESKENATT